MRINQGLRLIAFVLVLGLILSALFKIFSLPAGDDTLSVRQRFNEFYDEPENTWDAVFLGTSCVDREWSAPLAWKEYGMTVYPLNTDGQPLVFSTDILKEVRKTQDIKFAVVDIRGAQMGTLKPVDIRVRRITDSMRFSWNRLQTVKKAIDFSKEFFSRDDVKDGKKRLAAMDEPSLYFPFLKYHSRWKTGLYREDILGTESKMKGVYEQHAFDVKNVKPTEVIEETKDLNELQIRVLDEVLDYGKETGLDILFISSPSQLTEDEQLEVSAIIDYLEEKDAKVIDFNTNEKYQEMGIDFSSHFYNAHHMNSRGAVKFTEYFARYLHENYLLEDKRGNEAYKDWDEAYENYVEFYEKGWENAESSK